ncbi:hypothetical protein [Algoriphagus yeomjeoni]|uniref:Uncharacterized protein n=1 Tax=Algoriphagus yeomjeoni TaxID=291403 RepID=A0A327PT70_9BACT|nr:hypothetical protein [Algoriphagus yeomjeoni]RAI95269.1 hypothetical protein LV83_00520 [Algoriphagus yeomjeoni]
MSELLTKLYLDSAMKNFSIFLVLVFSFHSTSYGQIQGYNPNTFIPTFDTNYIIIKSSESIDKEFSFLKNTLPSFLEEFPNPDKNEDFYYEMDEKMARPITYGQNEFYFLGEKMDAFHLKDSKFSIGNGKDFIKIGDHHSSVSKLFPPYELEIRTDYGIIIIPLSYHGIVVDEPISLIVDLKTGNITKINI